MFKLLNRLFAKASPGQVQDKAKDTSGLSTSLTRNEIVATIDRDGCVRKRGLNQAVVGGRAVVVRAFGIYPARWVPRCTAATRRRNRIAQS